MKRYTPVDLSRVRTYPIAERKNKVSIEDFSKKSIDNNSFCDFLDTLPAILSAADMKALARDVVLSRKKDKPVIWAMGAHVIKCGLSPLLIQLIDEEIVTAVSMNGAGSIHDYEISLIGATSEDVAGVLHAGKFGMAEETGGHIHAALREGLKKGMGYGESLGSWILSQNHPYKEYSVLAHCAAKGIPVTVHAAIGTDIIHQHPSMDGAVLGEASFRDFTLLTAIVSEMGGGGVWLNMGSAVILPEVFLKAVSIAENLGSRVNRIITANFDMIRQYRPMENVVKRPTSTQGKGYSFTGHHEIMIPLLCRLLLMEKGSL